MLYPHQKSFPRLWVSVPKSFTFTAINYRAAIVQLLHILKVLQTKLADSSDGKSVSMVYKTDAATYP